MFSKLWEIFNKVIWEIRVQGPERDGKAGAKWLMAGLKKERPSW
jgi:hypothetical protein